MFRLKNYNRCPPGSFFYEQTEGVRRLFDSTPEIGCLAHEVMEFRKGNNLPRSSRGECLEDIDSFTCTRLNNNPRWVYDTDRSFSELHPVEITGRGCGSCGASVK